MAINDRPQVDSSAKNSSRSERRLNDWMNEDYQFVLRKEIPDKGCDFMCELLSGSGATNLKFPVQLKSIENPDFVSEGKYISYPILTSRLGYMLNLLPTTGIFVLFDVSTENLYYDYTFKIFERIKSDRKNDEWTKQEYVSIRISIGNLFSKEIISELHSSAKKIFDDAARMQRANGDRYQLPIVELDDSIPFDWNNTEHIRKWLRQYGQAMLFRFDLAPVYESLTRLRITEIENDKQLLLVACVAYGETGHYMESDLFNKKIRQKFELDQAETDTIEIVEARNLQKLGQMSPADFIRLLEKQASRATDKQNKLSVRINLQRFKIGGIEGPVAMPPEITNELYAIYKSIEESELGQDVKDAFSLWNAEHESHLLTHEQHLDYISFQMIRTTGRVLPREVWERTMREAMDKEIQFLRRVEQIANRAVKENHKFLQATAQSVLGTYALQKLFSLLSYPDTPKIPEEEMKHFTRYAFTAYRLFREIGHPVDAYRSLCTILELMYVTKHFYRQLPDEYIQVLQSDKAALENQITIPPYQLQLPPRLERITTIEESGVNNTLAEYPDADLENLARLVFNQLRLPEDRFINFHNEYLATRLFQQRCTDPDVQFFCYNYGSTDNIYIRPVQYILKNKISGIESPRSPDMNELLNSWGF